MLREPTLGICNYGRHSAAENSVWQSVKFCGSAAMPWSRSITAPVEIWYISAASNVNGNSGRRSIEDKERRSRQKHTYNTCPCTVRVAGCFTECHTGPNPVSSASYWFCLAVSRIRPGSPTQSTFLLQPSFSLTDSTKIHILYIWWTVMEYT